MAGRRRAASAGAAPTNAEPGLLPMEARLVDSLPAEAGWQYEPKWDGFRCLATKRGDAVELMSKSGKPLARYFPDIVAALAALPEQHLVLDGELLIPVGPELSFGALQDRLHPATSRVTKLAAAHPARLMLFDLLWSDADGAIADRPLSERRSALERFHRVHRSPTLRLSPTTADGKVAARWLAATGEALDGVVAKRLDEPYRPGDRAFLKVKRLRTADCVVGGFRYGTNSREVASLLLGLYDEDGLLHHVGFTSALAAQDKPALTKRLEGLVEAPGFTGDAPGGPSRWTGERASQWQPLRAELVVEVRYDHVTEARFRHGTALLRWRPDKAPRRCTMEQLRQEARPAVLDAALGAAEA